MSEKPSQSPHPEVDPSAGSPYYQEELFPEQDGQPKDETEEAPVGTNELEQPADTPERSGTGYEQRLAAKLLNPELTGTTKVKDGANKAAFKTVNMLETAAHKGLDVHAAVKDRRLKAKHRRAEDKQIFYEDKAENSFFAFRRKKFAAKAMAQKNVVAKRQEERKEYADSVEERHKRRQSAIEGRSGAYEARYQGLIDRKQFATLRKAERRQKWLGRYGRLPVKAERKHKLQQKRSLLDQAIDELMAS